MRTLLLVFASLCGFCFLGLLVFIGSVVQGFKMVRVCLPAWPFLATAMIVLMAIFGFWPGLGLWFAGFWVLGFFASDQLYMLKILFTRKITA